MADLTKWAAKQFPIVDENGACVAAVKLLSEDGQCWETWVPPYPPPAEWAEVANTLLGELMLGWPARPIKITFVALDRDGQVRSQLPMQVTGKTKGGNMSLGGESQALAASMDAQAVTMQKILMTAGSHVEVMGKNLQIQNEALSDAYAYIKAKNEEHALTDGDPATQLLKTEISNNLPKILDIAGRLADAFGMGANKPKASVPKDAGTNGAGKTDTKQEAS